MEGGIALGTMDLRTVYLKILEAAWCAKISMRDIMSDENPGNQRAKILR